MERRGLTPDEWTALGWYERSEIIAFYRATDTMKAWEQFIAEQEIEKQRRKKR